MRRIGARENMVNCIRIVYEGTKFCVECGENEVTSFAPQTNGIMDYINIDNSHDLSIGRATIPGLLFADDLAAS
jgi:RNA polymerase subunit RPABC4/transcription elongation factor Spt4